MKTMTMIARSFLLLMMIATFCQAMMEKNIWKAMQMDPEPFGNWMQTEFKYGQDQFFEIFRRKENGRTVLIALLLRGLPQDYVKAAIILQFLQGFPEEQALEYLFEEDDDGRSALKLFARSKYFENFTNADDFINMALKPFGKTKRKYLNEMRQARELALTYDHLSIAKALESQIEDAQNFKIESKIADEELTDNMVLKRETFDDVKKRVLTDFKDFGPLLLIIIFIQIFFWMQ